MRVRVYRIQEEHLNAYISELERIQRKAMENIGELSTPTPSLETGSVLESTLPSDKHWQLYSAAALESALASGKTVIIDFTADWCPTCKAFAIAVLHTEPITAVLEEKGIVSLTADCTREGEATELLRKLGPEQVPTLALFDPANSLKPTVIRGGCTQKTLLERLQ